MSGKTGLGAMFSGRLLAAAVLLSCSALTAHAATEPVAAHAPKSGLPTILVVGLGGTITATAEGRARFQSYAKPRIPLTDVIQRLEPELADVANVSSIELSNKSSAALAVSDLYQLTRTIDEALSQKYDAVIVTTGTNIMEELAYWTDLTVRSPKPVVFTGSMRQSNTISFDGEANLFNAVRLAASNKTYCYGTVLMLNDEYSAAREVAKTDAVRLDTFKGGRYGALGSVDESVIRAVHAPARVLSCGKPSWNTPFDLSTITPEKIAKAEIVYSYLEADRAPIDALVKAGVKGIVTAGHGAGGISTAQAAARSEAVRQSVVFVTATRTGSGAVYDPAKPEKGIIAANDLTPQKARILLQLALSFTQEPEQVRSWFKTIGWQDFDMSPSR